MLRPYSPEKIEFHLTQMCREIGSSEDTLTPTRFIPLELYKMGFRGIYTDFLNGTIADAIIRPVKGEPKPIYVPGSFFYRGEPAGKSKCSQIFFVLDALLLIKTHQQLSPLADKFIHPSAIWERKRLVAVA